MERFSACDHLLLFVLVLLLTTTLHSPVLCHSASTLTKCNFPAIFNFGDSNSDTGGLSAAFGQAPPPYAQSLGLPFLSAYLDSVGSNFSHGANFATAGSTIRPQNTTLRESGYSPISLDVQFVQYSDFRRRSQIVRKHGGVFELLLPEDNRFARALYTLDIGQNDLAAGYKLNMSTQQVKAYVPDAIDQFSKVIKKVYAQGGRSFWIHNTGPVGCYPYIMSRYLITAAQIDEHGCASSFNEVSQYFNLLLKEAVVKLRKALPLAAITYVDIYTAKYTLISRARKLGFENPFLACCGHGGKFNYNRHAVCGAKKLVNGKGKVIATSCKDPSIRINWDGTHLSEAANKWIFDQIVNGSFSDPPVPLSSACHRMDP